MARVAILGTGAMGSRMANALLRAQHQVTVWNRTPERTGALRELGATVAPSPRDAALDAEFVIAMVRDDEASHTIWLDSVDGALAGLSKGAVAIESSTLSVQWVKALAEKVEAAGCEFLDAPVAGSRPQADARQLIYFVGGAAKIVERCTPIFQCMGSAVHHAGPAGSGATVKLVVNTLFGVQVAALAELIGVLKRSNIDVAKAIDIIGATPVCSSAANAAAASMLAGNFAPQFPVELVDKDLRYMQNVAARDDAQTPITDATKDVMHTAISKGMGDDHLTGIFRLYNPVD